MSERPTPRKATITLVDDTSKSVTCHFNPDTFKLEREVKWNVEVKEGKDVATVEFKGGQGHAMGPIELVFDTTDTGTDVREEYKPLIEISKVDPAAKNSTTNQSEPSKCRFQWGEFLSFTAVLTKLTETFTMFNPDGVPLRAKVGVTLREVPEERSTQTPQNPTTRTDPRKVWVVQEGQTLDWIAYQEYGDSAYWRHIAETNDLTNPRDLYPGQMLKLVPLP